MDTLIQFFSQLSIDSFEYPAILFFLLIIPIYVAIAVKHPEALLRHMQFPTLGFNNEKTDAPQTPICPFQTIILHSKHFWGFVASIVLLSLFVATLTIAVAHPYGGANVNSQTEGIDIYFALDMSASMKAYDYPLQEVRQRYARNLYTPNRFDIARTTMLEFIENRASRCNDKSQVLARCDRIGITLFAKSAYIAAPITKDYALLKALLKQRKIYDINAEQSAIGDGIMRCVASLRHSAAQSRNIILVTDGDRRGGKIGLTQAMEAARLYQIKIFPILIGKSNHAVLAHSDSGGTINFHEAEFPVNFELLQEIAKTTGGKAMKASDGNQFKEQLNAILNTLEPTTSIEARHIKQQDLSLHYTLLAFIFGLLYFITSTSFVRQYP